MKNILVIDDNKPNLTGLELDGYFVKHFYDAEKAFNHLVEGDNQWKYDLVLIDEELEKNDGYFNNSGTEFGKMLNEVYPFLTLVMVTAARYDIIKSIDAFVHSGFIYFMNKDDFYVSPQSGIDLIKDLRSYKNRLRLRSFMEPGGTLFKGKLGEPGQMDVLLEQFQERPDYSILEEKISLKALDVLFQIKQYVDSLEIDSKKVLEAKRVKEIKEDNLELNEHNIIQYATYSFKGKPPLNLEDNKNLELLEDKLTARRVFIGFTYLFRNKMGKQFNLDDVAALVQRGYSKPVTITRESIYRGVAVYSGDLGLDALQNQIIIRGKKITYEEKEFISNFLVGFVDLMKYAKDHFPIEEYYSLSNMVYSFNDASLKEEPKSKEFDTKLPYQSFFHQENPNVTEKARKIISYIKKSL